MKVNVSINDELMEKIDNYSKENYITRSHFFTMVSNQFLAQLELTSALKEVSKAVKKISENNIVDDESQKQLDLFEKIVSMIK